MRTITFEQVQVEKIDNFVPESIDTVLDCKKFFDKEHDKLVMSSCDSEHARRPHYSHGLLGTIIQAYSKHVPLKLRPDDIWLSIVLAFGNYVKHNSEELRHLFVDHQGRKKLNVNVPSPFFESTTPEHWKKFIGEMAKEIDKNIKQDITAWMVPNFSTTTLNDQTVARIALMGAVQNYFAMKFTLCCGLSKVILDGTLNDWKLLREKAEKLYLFGVKDLSNWADLLLPVLDELVLSYEGKVNTDFWQKICTYTTRGSGCQKTFRGWFLVFSPFNDKGRYVLRPLDSVKQDGIYGVVDDNDIVDCAIDVQVQVDDHTGEDYEKSPLYNPMSAMFGKSLQVVFYGGLLMSSYDQKENVLSPASGWLLIRKKEIKFEDMLDKHHKTLKSWNSNLSEDQTKAVKDMLYFSHHMATKLLFPNNELLDLVEWNIHYFFNDFYRGSKFGEKEMESYMLRMAKKSPYDETDFSKYIDTSRISEIIKSYSH